MDYKILDKLEILQKLMIGEIELKDCEFVYVACLEENGFVKLLKNITFNDLICSNVILIEEY